MDEDDNESLKGKIYSVQVKNFVTYDSVVYYPGEYLNVILGPNGTGKSTLVAAIVLGMGGQPKTLSRSLNIEDYVKNGKERAEIEIYIYKDSAHKTKFKRMFNTNGQNKFFVNNDECSAKKYVESVAKFNIQINNLCQFLPQDRVQDFAKMNPQELLVNTQCSVCSSECIEMFEKLKQLRAQQQDDGTELNTHIAKLNEKETRVTGMKEQIDNINLKSTLMKKYDICCKKKAWMEFEELFIKFKEIENDLQISLENKKHAEDELAPLSNQSKQLSQLKQRFTTNIKSETDKTHSFLNELNKLDEKSCQFEQAITKAEGDLTFMKTSQEENSRELESALLEQRVIVEDVKKTVATVGSEADKRNQIDEITKERTVLTGEVRSLNDENRQINRQLDEEIKPRLNSVNNKIQQMENSRNIKLELLRTRFNQVHQAVMWLRQNQKRFKGKVYEPLILELNVKSGYAKYFESVIANRDLVAFSCENKDDVELMFKHLRSEMKLNVNIIHTKPVRSTEKSPPISELSEFGFTNFLLELIEGPMAIISYLCRTYRIHMIPLGTDYTLSVTERIPKKYSLFFTPNHRFSINISKYNKHVSSDCQEIVGHNLLNIAIDYGLLENLKLQRENVLRSSDKCRNKQTDIENRIKSLEDEINKLDTQKAQIESKYFHVTSLKQKLQRHIRKIENLKTSTVDITKETEKFKKKAEGILKSLTEIQEKKLEVLKKLNDSDITLKCHHEKHRIFLQNNADLENRLRDAKDKLDNAIRYINNIKKSLDEYKDKCKKQQAIACKMTDNKKPSDAQNFPYKKQFDKLPDTLEELVDHMNELQGRMECVRENNPEIVTEYENLKRDIERLEVTISKMQSSQLGLSGEMDSIHKEWYDIITSIVTQINQNFSNFMMSMGFAGEVELTRNHERDYAEYGIAIRVKYRNNEQLQSLDRYIQSGGERAVAIAAYTLSLQHMSHVPFRYLKCFEWKKNTVFPRRCIVFLCSFMSLALTPFAAINYQNIATNLISFNTITTNILVNSNKIYDKFSQFRFQQIE